MIENPDNHLANFKNAGADRIIVHIETVNHSDKTLNKINELGIKNPILDSIGAIGNIRGQLFNVGLDEEEALPPLENPFDKLPLPTLEGTPTSQLPPNVAGASPTAGFVGQQNVNLKGVSFETLPESERYKTLFPNG